MNIVDQETDALLLDVAINGYVIPHDLPVYPAAKKTNSL